MATIKELWQQIEWYLDTGISIIPVRDKEEVKGDKIYAPKTPYYGWKQFQLSIVPKSTLFHELDYLQTTAVAMIAGKVSGNMEVIDIDVKHWPGIDARFFSDIKAIYPDIFAKLRIHKTPSGGFHIPYRIADQPPVRNLKLCSQKDHKEAGIETRGEGGYVLVPPSLGYTVVKNNPIPVLSQGERDSLIALAKSYDEKALAKVKEYKPTRQQSDYYDENPFEHFNRSLEAEHLLLDHGFKEINRTPAFIQYTRPGKANGVSATFNIEKRLFYFFTTSTQFEAEKWYQPCSVLAEFEFSGDKKALYKHLVEKGYGKIKAKVEARIVRATAMKGGKLPANFSPESKERLVVEGNEIKNRYPHGIFWVQDEYGDYTISREKLYTVAEGLGYRLNPKNEQIVLIDGYKILQITEREFADGIKAYVREEDASEYEKIANAYESFMQRSGKYTVSRIEFLDLGMVMQSTKTQSVKFYNNCYVVVTSSAINIHNYEELSGKLVWADAILPRDYQPMTFENASKCLYFDYLEKSTNNVDPNGYLFKCLGYLAHDFKDESMAYIFVLTEMVPNPKDGGGSGKNIFTNLLGQITSHHNIPGSQVQFNEKFMQSWKGQRILTVSDAKKNFDFMFLKELSGGNGLIKKLYKDESTVHSSEMPKPIVSTNYSYDVSDGGLKRRIKPIEFTNYFTINGGVDAVYNKMFPEDWTSFDWSGFDNIMLHSIKLYLSSPKISTPGLSEGGWLKQFDQSYGSLTRQFIEENIDIWQRNQFISNDKFNEAYNHFCVENQINQRFKLSSKLMNKALEDYCISKGIKFDGTALKRENGIPNRGKMFDSGVDLELPF